MERVRRRAFAADNVELALVAMALRVGTCAGLPVYLERQSNAQTPPQRFSQVRALYSWRERKLSNCIWYDMSLFIMRASGRHLERQSKAQTPPQRLSQVRAL